MKNKEKKAYTEILDVLRKYEDICIFDVKHLERKANIHLLGIDIIEKYGYNININSIDSLQYNTFGSYRKIIMYDGDREKIAWPDNGKQPDNERLLEISFPSGAYIFSDTYPEELFKEFIDEIKSYKPDYIDSHNHSYYFTLENGSKIFNNFEKILDTYRKKYIEGDKQRKIDKLKEELKQLESK